MPSHRVLGLFAKQPVAGAVKTRLAAATASEWAAQVADAFLHDTVDRLASMDARRVLAFTPDDAEAYFAKIIGGRFQLMAQGPGDLGQRMARFFACQIAAGARGTVLLGTDSPTVPLELVEQAFAALTQADLVLGPATDGGYYLIGCGVRLPPIFEGIAWSSPSVLADTMACLTDPSWRVALLPPWYDVDTWEDWQTLCGHLLALERSGTDSCLPRTMALVKASTKPR
jgi:rSAM/selenodomain-associated transferase 1